jgi:hypothetical protein
MQTRHAPGSRITPCHELARSVQVYYLNFFGFLHSELLYCSAMVHSRLTSQWVDAILPQPGCFTPRRNLRGRSQLHESGKTRLTVVRSVPLQPEVHSSRFGFPSCHAAIPFGASPSRRPGTVPSVGTLPSYIMSENDLYQRESDPHTPRLSIYLACSYNYTIANPVFGERSGPW